MILRIISYAYLLRKACNTRMIDPSHSTHPVKQPVVYCVKILSPYSHKHFRQISSMQESIDLIIEYTERSLVQTRFQVFFSKHALVPLQFWTRVVACKREWYTRACTCPENSMGSSGADRALSTLTSGPKPELQFRIKPSG